jgi:general secretion pathway protein H
VGPLIGADRSRHSRAGFTLVEIVVVIAIVAIAVALASANLGDDERRATEREAKRLAGALEHAAALAQWQRVTIGVAAEGALYRFFSRDANERWTAVANDEVLALRALPAGITVMPLRYAGAPLAADAIVPLRPSGRNEPYELVMSSAASRFVVSADPLNRVAIVAAGR